MIPLKSGKEEKDCCLFQRDKHEVITQTPRTRF